jgi:Tfp pilus assembly protein PilO
MRRTNVLLVVLALVALTALWWFLIIGPRNDRIAQAEDDLASAQVEESTLRTRIAQLREIKDAEVSYIFAIGEMETSIPTAPDADAFIEDITFLAQQTGVDLVSLSLSPPSDAALETELPAFTISVALSVQGEYFEILGLLYGLESMERLVRVDSVNLSPVGPDVEADETEEPADGEASSAGEDEVAEPRQRPSVSGLTADLTLKLFTRSEVVVQDLLSSVIDAAEAGEEEEQ